MYGSLLGAVRDHNFIGHDFDFDAGYVSRHRDSAKVGAEVAEIALALLERGFRVESRVVCLYVFDDLSGPERIDIFQLFFDEAGVLQFPWGIAGTTPFRIEQWQGTREIEFARTTGLIPHHAEAMVETMYGPNWRIPNPGFAWARDRKSKSPGGRVPPKAGSLVNWMSYWAHNSFAEPSTFFTDVVRRDGLPRTVTRSRMWRRAGQSGLRSGRIPGRGTRLELDRDQRGDQASRGSRQRTASDLQRL